MDSLKKDIIKCYKDSLELIAGLEHVNSLLNDTKNTYKSVLCINEQNYFGPSYIYFVKSFKILKEDSEIFKYFINAIDNHKPIIPNEILDSFSKDLMLLFLPDISSEEENTKRILRLFKALIQNLLDDYLNNKTNLLLENRGLMINRLLKIFLENTNNRNYINLLFGKIFEDTIDINEYLKSLKYHERKNDINTEDVKEIDINSSISTSMYIPSYKQKKKDYSKTIINESKVDIDNLSEEDQTLFCEKIINLIVKKLPYMPSPVRYLCKIIDQLVSKYVIQI